MSNNLKFNNIINLPKLIHHYHKFMIITSFKVDNPKLPINYLFFLIIFQLVTNLVYHKKVLLLNFILLIIINLLTFFKT